MTARFAGRKHDVAAIRTFVADNIAKGMLYLAATDADWMTGVPLPIDGGFLAA